MDQSLFIHSVPGKKKMLLFHFLLHVKTVLIVLCLNVYVRASLPIKDL